MLTKNLYLTFGSVLFCSVFIIYIISTMFIVPLKDQEVISVIYRPQEGENSSLSYADKLFKLYDGVETFVMFIGYPRSSHSLVGAILDAHPEIIIPHQYDVIGNLRRYRSLRREEKSMQKYRLFFELHQLSTEQAMFSFRASANRTLLKENLYTYYIPGLWQGGYKQRIKVIGDKRGGATSMALAQNQMNVLEEIRQVVDVPIKFIHVIRNPFDNIATLMLRYTKSREIVRRKDVKVNNTMKLEKAINNYFQMAASNQRVRERYGDAVLDIPGHETVLRPRETLQRLCDHLGVTCFEEYIEKSIKILYGTPSVTRNKVVWTKEQKRRVTEMMKNYSFLKEYSFDKYPS